jgi:phage/plasmid primase-like uncharacterized protein
MARDIDVDDLDVDSVAYLRQRPWLIEEAKQVHGVDDIEERMAAVEQAEQAKQDKVVESAQYDELNLKQLRELAENRQLDKSGNKAELVQRLKENDDVLAAQLRKSEPVSINENPGDSVIGENHPVPE